LLKKHADQLMGRQPSRDSDSVLTSSVGAAIVGAAVGIAASFSTTLAGYIADSLGTAAAFLGLFGIAAAGFVFVVALMPETREWPHAQ
jgi:hypothetical protein